MPVSPQELAIYFGPAIGLSLVLALIASRAWRSSSTARGQWAAPLAIGFGVAISMLAMGKWKSPGFPPTVAENWLIWAGGVLAVIGLLDAAVPLWRGVRAGWIVILAGAMLYLVLRPVIHNSWPTGFSALVVAGGTIAAALTWLVIERPSRRQSDALPPLILMLAATGLSAYMSLANSLDLGLRAGSIASTLGPIFVVALWRPRLSLARGGAMVFIVLFAGLLAACYAYTSEMVTWRLLTIAAVPLLGFALLWLPLGGWKRWVTALGPVLIVLATVLFYAYRDFKAAQEAGPW